MTDNTPSATNRNKPTSLCWFPWYPKDWITSDTVGRMNDAQIAAYIMLLSRQWLCKDCKLPEDIETLSKYAMHDASSPDMQMVLDRFPVQPDGGRANERLLDLYKMQHAKYLKRKHAADTRWMHNAMHNAMEVHGASVSVSSSGISGEGGVGEGLPPRDGLLGLVDRIRSCRPEYANMREQDIVAILNGNSDTKSVERVIVDWCVEQGNALTPMGNPIASLRKRIAAITESDAKNPYAKYAKEGAR